MSTPHREEIRQSNRGAVHQGLIQKGIEPKEADIWLGLWEVEAQRHGLQPAGDYFWDAGRGWIDAQWAFLTAHLAEAH